MCLCEVWLRSIDATDYRHRCVRSQITELTARLARPGAMSSAFRARCGLGSKRNGTGVPLPLPCVTSLVGLGFLGFVKVYGFRFRIIYSI